MLFERKPINPVEKPMNNDYLELENAEGMPALVDSSIALDFLLAIKTGIRTLGMAITEIEDAEARVILQSLLHSQIDLHAEMTELMIRKSWLHPFNISEQFSLDQISAKTSLQIAELNLFPGDTSRLGTFATPNY